jgi:hypothetical protein
MDDTYTDNINEPLKVECGGETGSKRTAHGRIVPGSERDPGHWKPLFLTWHIENKFTYNGSNTT